MPRKIPSKAILKAIKGSGGIVSEVARRVGIERQSMHRRLNKEPRLKEALEQERETLLDVAEGVLYHLAINERRENSLLYLLSTVGKSRGYSKRKEVTGADGGPVEVVYEIGGATKD